MGIEVIRESEVEELVHSCNTIADFRQSERDSRMSPGDLAKLLETKLVAVFVCDVSGRISLCNHRAIELWGRKLYTTDDAEEMDSAIATEMDIARWAMSRSRPIKGAIACIRRTDHSTCRVEIDADPFFDDVGRVVGAICIMRPTEDAWHTSGVALAFD